MDKKILFIIMFSVLITASIIGIIFLLFRNQNLSKEFNNTLDTLRIENDDLKSKISLMNQESSSITSGNKEILPSLIKLFDLNPCLPEVGSILVNIDTSTNAIDDSSITITYGGLFDDSVNTTKSFTPIYCHQADESDPMWTFGTTTETWKCQSGRGHQDFTADDCL